MQQKEAWRVHQDADQTDTARKSTGSRRVLTHVTIVVILLIVVAFVGWHFASRTTGRFAATGSVLSVNRSTGTFSVQPARPSAPDPGGATLPRPTSNQTASVTISNSTDFQICRGRPASAGAAAQGCSPASFAAVKAGEQVDVVGAVSNNTVTATRVQVL